MHAVLSLILSLIIAFALSNLFNFFIVLLISFVCIDLFVCYLDTVIKGKNKMVGLAFSAFEAMNDSDAVGFLWMFLALPGLVFVLLAGVGGIVTAPLWSFLSNSKPKINKILFITIVTLVLLGLYFYGVVLLISPIMIYRYIHFGLIIGVFIAATVISLALTIYYKVTEQLKTVPTVVLSVAEVGLLPVMICGLVLSMNTIYSITTVEDMNVFANAPIGYDTAIVLENDLDFTDKNVGWYGACRTFKGVFDGKGHTISNVNYKGNFKGIIDKYDRYDTGNFIEENRPSLGMGFVRENKGVIRNLNFENCKVTVQKLGNEYTEYHNYFFGFITSFNSGTVENCSISDCQAKYFLEYTSQIRTYFNLAIGAGKRGTEVTVTTNTVDDDFYDEASPINGKSWSKIG